MFKNNFKFAWRNLLKDRQFTLLNLIGLSTGLACTLLIYLWVNDEMSFDKFHEKDSQLFQVMESKKYESGTGISDESSGMLSEILAKENPEIEYASAEAPSSWFQKFTLSAGEKNMKASGQYVGKDYFNIFSFKLLDGNKNDVLKDKKSIVISENLARKLFNTTDNVVGKIIRLDHNESFFIAGIFENIPYHSSEQFDFLLSFEYYKDIQPWVTTWSNTGPHNYIVLKKGTDIKAFNKKIAGTVMRYAQDSLRTAFVLPFSDNYLYNTFDHGKRLGGRIEYVRLFSIIAIFILAIACINFMNLSTAKASRRLKEVGIKKVIGASRKQLVFQYLTEPMLLTFIAAILALAIVILLLPQFNELTGKQISFSINSKIILAVAVITIFTGLLSGSYPALYMSGFNPIAVLKGKLSASFGEVFARKGLVIFQFVLSVIFIVAVVVVYQQMKLIQTKSLGFNKDNIIRFDSEGKVLNNQETFIAELKKIPGVINASGTFHNIIGRNYSTAGLEWPGKNPRETIFFEGVESGYDFIETLGMQMAAGRQFSKGYGDEFSKILLNEAAVKTIGLKDPIGKIIKLYGKDKEIIGIVKDYHFESLHETVKPLYMTLATNGPNSWYKIVARIKGTDQKETIDRIRQFYASYNPGFILDYNFLDEAYQKQYLSENRVSVLSRYFAGLAIVISCLGLFGLVAFTAQRRQKEIGVRKVIGASISDIVLMLSADFLKLVLIAILIAFPLSWWAMNSWLNGFAFRITLGPGVFIAAGLSIMIITILTISLQAVKAALSNPVKSLRSE